jgi:hypothetical protein
VDTHIVLAEAVPRYGPQKGVAAAQVEPLCAAMERWAQVLDEKNFARIKPGMHRDEVVATIGESKAVFGLARERGYVWNYRYVTPHCFWFQIEFANDDTVRSKGYGQPPECRIPKLR